MTSKLEIDGRVAVLLTRDVGTGWSTLNKHAAPDCIFDAETCLWVLAGKDHKTQPDFRAKFGDEFYVGTNVLNLCVDYVDKGRTFQIVADARADGWEYLLVQEPWHVA